MVGARPEPDTHRMESHDEDPTTPQGGDRAADASDPSERPTERSGDAAGTPAGDPSPTASSHAPGAGGAIPATEGGAVREGGVTPAGGAAEGGAIPDGGAIPAGGAAEGPRRLYRSRDER